MGKRILYIVFPLLVLGLIILGYFLHRESIKIITDPYKAISPGASIIIETADIKSFLNSVTTGKGIFAEAAKIKEWEIFTAKLKYFADQINRTEFKELMIDDAAVISFHPGGNRITGTLISITIPPGVSSRKLKDIFQSSGIKQIREVRKNNKLIFEIPYKIRNINDTVFVSVVSGLLLCSNSGIVLENAIAQTGKNSDLRDLEGFSRVFLASGKNEDKIFVVFANLPKILKNLFRENEPETVEKIASLAGTAGGDIFIDDDGFVLSGYTESNDTSEFFSRYSSLPSKTFHTYKILPAATILYETTILPDSLKENMSGDDQASPASRIRQLTGEEITRAVIDIKDASFEENTLYIYELSNRAAAEQVLIKADTGIIWYSPDDQIRIPVYHTSVNGLYNFQKNDFSPLSLDLYIAFYDNFLVSGKSCETIKRLLHDNLLNKTLENDLVFRDFESSLPTRGCYFFYCVPSRILDYIGLFLSDEMNHALRVNRSSINKIQAAGWSFSSSNGMIYNSLSVRFREKERKESSTEWETLLDTVAATKPFFFTNHITGSKEIFLQDLNNNAYLINSAGRVLWKIRLNEKINGSVYMIDYFGNGKYQLLFSSRNFIHLLDRNGNYVERYPVRLRSPATNSLALFDYDKNLEYRLFIAGEDKLLYSYDKTGNVVKGWNPFRTNGIIRDEARHFRISGKDYIVISDETSMYFLDRTGNKRINFREPVIKAAGSGLTLNPGSRPYIACSSPDGTVQHIYFDGNIKRFVIKKFSSQHRFDIFDIDDDGFGEYIFIDGDMMYLYDSNNSMMFSRKFDSTNLGEPLDLVFSATNRKIGIYDIGNRLIYLIDENGDADEGFPLSGASMFSVGRLTDKNSWNLIVGGTDRFLYNYKIESGLN